MYLYINHLASKIKNFLRRSVKQQISSIFIVVTIVPACVIGVVSISVFISQLQERYEVQVTAECTRVKAILFDITTTMYSSCEPIISTQSYRDLFAVTELNDNRKESYDSLCQTISSLKSNTAAISTIGIYTDNPNIQTNLWIHYEVEELTVQEWYPKEDNSLWDHWTCSYVPLNSQQNSYDLTLTRRINTGVSDYHAYLVVTISSNYMRNRLITTDSFLMASVDGLPSFFSSDNHLVQFSMPFDDSYFGEYYSYLGQIEINGKKALTCISTLSPYKVSNKFYILVGDFGIYKQIRHLVILIIIIIIIAIAGPVTVITLFSSYFSKRIDTLRRAMHQASHGNYNIIDNFKGVDELADTFQDLKHMVKFIHDREAEFFETRIQEQKLINMQQEMEYKMLASQINPHFLYNTLETIRMQALGMQNQDVATSIMLLARSMHYVLENTGRKYSTLAQELEHVKTYLQIQKLRFFDRVNWDFYIDESINTEKYVILPLLLQPIVENAIVHGLENKKEKGHISIIVEKDKEGYYTITVNDNGEGIPSEEMDKLNKSLNGRKNKVSSIGLYNINQRIRMCYGEMYGLTIKSEIYRGTTVSMILPEAINNE